MVPEGWRQVLLADLVTFKSGGTPSTQNSDYWGGEIPWISAKDLTSFRLSDSQLKVTMLGVQSGTRLVPEGTVLILVRGMTLHKDVPVGLTTRPMTFNQDVRALLPKNGVSPEFLAYSLVASKQRLRGFVDTAGHGTGRLANDFLQELPILLPPAHEQSIITRCLTVWDRALTQTEKLIEAKQKLKKGLLQKLITGKYRFPEFGPPVAEFERVPLKWQEVKIGEIFKRVTRKNRAGVTRVLTASGEHGLVDQKDFFNRSVAGESLDGYFHLQKGEYAFNRSSMRGYPYGAIKRLNNHSEGILSTLYICFALSSEEHCSDFLMHYFEAGHLNWQLRGIVQVGARAHGLLNVTVSDFFGLKLLVPLSKEQERIASVLNALDAEIRLWQNKLRAIQEQKRGLMQKLLTGQIRVKATAKITALGP